MIQLLASSFHGAILGESIAILVLIVAVLVIYLVKGKSKASEPVAEPAQVNPVEEETLEEEPVEETPVEEPVEEVEEPVAEEVQSEEEPSQEAVEETAVTEVVPTVTSIVGEEAEEDSDGINEVFFAGRGGSAIILNRSFMAKLSQSKDEMKIWYSDLKNCLLSYKDIKVRKSWKRESYYYKNRCVAKMSIRGKTLCVYFAVQPAKYSETKYKVEDVSDTKIYSITPCMYRMKNVRRAKYATQIISDMLATVTEKIDGRQPVDYRPKTETTEDLIQKGLIKVVEKKN